MNIKILNIGLLFLTVMLVSCGQPMNSSQQNVIEMARMASCTEGFAQGVRATLSQFPKGSTVDLEPILNQMKCDAKLHKE